MRGAADLHTIDLLLDTAVAGLGLAYLPLDQLEPLL